MQDFSSPLSKPFFSPEGNHGILLLHGFTGSPGHMRKLGDELALRGFAVQGILLPGHGTEPKDMARFSWQDWLLTARQAAKEMREKYQYFTVAGLSMGGLLALILAQEMDLTACVTIAAPMDTTNSLRRLALPLSLLHPVVVKKKDPAKQTLDPEYHFEYDSFPTKSTHDLNVLMSRAKRHLDLIQCPLLAVQSEKDKTITRGSLDEIMNGISSREKAKLWLKDAPHVCTIAPEWKKIADAMEKFLREAEK